MAQSDAFPNEISTLTKSQGPPTNRHRIVAKSSPIFRTWPFLDENSVLHWYHRRFRHANREVIVNEIRQRFEIGKLRSLVMKVAKKCTWCHVMKAVPRSPAMAPLPEMRLSAFVRPFTYVGLDYFGPVLVKVGRNNIKRWVALFTCLTLRAVHMEVVHSLSTVSCIMAVRRFVSRRGPPREVWTDNATCFHGASNELKSAQTSWKFIPPASPHMGGAWERLVRSVKEAVGTIWEAPRKPDDETFETILYEAEAMINSRPLTYIPLSSDPSQQLEVSTTYYGPVLGAVTEGVSADHHAEMQMVRRSQRPGSWRSGAGGWRNCEEPVNSGTNSGSNPGTGWSSSAGTSTDIVGNLTKTSYKIGCFGCREVS
ncbi:uncharacterized protein LOC131438888 [Malaya genurostris]|uniref:uncharacterized protein LOC131438888 n=1 Tax=Malaya genurostris TaxID=325434 RepID=UPI0026F385F5|nr:uncharacterized protein LOC131438888 [Malaya genurostris]